MKISKIIKVLLTLKFSNPKRSRVLVLYNKTSDIVRKTILYDIDYSILPVNENILYMSPSIFVNMLKNLIIMYSWESRYRHLAVVYLLSCVEYIKPRIAITFIDNSFLFHALSRIYHRAEFYAIQNGVKLRDDVNEALSNYRDSRYVISMTNFICFGEYDKDLYEKYGHKVDKFHPVGALIGGYYMTEMAEKNQTIDYDICLVSQWRESIMLNDNNSTIKKALTLLDNLLFRYINEKKISLGIALCSNSPKEKEYFKEVYGGCGVIIDFNRLAFSTYKAMMHSRIIVSYNSAAAVEAFGWKKKVLLANFSGDKEIDFLRDSVWSTNKYDYDDFREKLDYLFRIDEDKYRDMIADDARYLMNYDFSRPAHAYIRKIIFDCLNNRQPWPG